MMAYQLTKHALCLVIPEARVGSKKLCGTKTSASVVKLFHFFWP
jgi:hypothetical protein